MLTKAQQSKSGSRFNVTIAIVSILAAASVAVTLVALFPPRVYVQVGFWDVLNSLLAFTVFFSFGALTLVLRRTSHREFGLYTAAFGLRSLLAIVLALSFQFDDEAALHAAAVADIGGGYSRLLEIVYSLFGSGFLTAKALNVTLGSLLVVFVGDLVENPSHKAFAQRLALVAPPLVVYSSVNLKETTTALLLVLAVSPILRLWRHQLSILGGVARLSLALTGLWWIRGVSWAALGGLAVATGLVTELLAHRRGLHRGRLYLLVVGMTIAVLFAGPRLAKQIEETYVAPRVGPGRSTSYFVNRTFAEGSGVTRYLDRTSPLGARNLAVLWGRGLFVPSPLRILSNPSAALAVEMSSSIGWYVLLLSALKGVGRTARINGTAALSGAAIFLSFVTASLSSLGSDPVRHRVVLVPLLCALASGIMSQAPSRIVAKIVWGLTIGAAVLYNFLYALTLFRGEVG